MGTLKTLASPQLGSSAFVSVSALELETAGTHVLETGGQEHVLNILAGTCSVRVALPDGQRMAFDPVGRRDSIFGGKPEAVYVPVNSRCEVTCRKAPFEAAIFAAPTDQIALPAHITPEEVRTVDAGKSDWQRQVHILMGDSGPATRMILGETESPPGNWSGFPPHRHTRDNPPHETNLEELYYFKFMPASGFIIGGIYDEPGAKEQARLRIFRQGQVFDVPHGYHFLAPCPGHRVRYAWVLGGQTKKFGSWLDDTELAWLHTT